MAFEARLALLLAADEHLNTGLGALWVKQMSLIPDFKGTPLSLHTSVFKAFSVYPVTLAGIRPAQGALSQPLSTL